jgi:hypothetical protein
LIVGYVITSYLRRFCVKETKTEIRYRQRWTEIDVIQTYPVTIYLGLGGGYLGTRPWFSAAMNPDHLPYQGNQTQIRQRRVEFENRGGMGFGRKRPHDRQATVPFAVIISRIAALLPPDLSPHPYDDLGDLATVLRWRH